MTDYRRARAAPPAAKRLVDAGGRMNDDLTPREDFRPESDPSEKRRSRARPNGGGNDQRPTIQLRANDIERIVDEAEAALIKADRGLYQRDGKIVCIDSITAIAAKGVQVHVQRICERGDHALREDLCAAAAFQKYDARSKDFVDADPPMTVVQTLKERSGRLRFPILSGVINAPTMRADGSLLTEPGYDADTGLLFDPLGVEFPVIPERPTRKDAEAALAKLKHLIDEFPFVTGAHHAVALSAILTAVVRRTLKSAPLHGFTAPVAGSGKGKLVNLCGSIATGSEVPVTAQANDDEMEKRLASSLFAGDPIISIDNCTKPVGGNLLCQMLTEVTVKPRILGESKNPTRSTGAFVTSTGQNLKIAADMVRRSIICHLDPKVERPELREFKIKDLIGFAKANRPALVVAVLTILRAYHVAGYPDAPPRLGSFEEWSDRVRGALMWLGEADPVATMEEIRSDDPELAGMRAVMNAWRETFHSQSMTVAKILKTATEQQRSADSYEGRVEFVNEDLREALMTVAGQGSIISSRALGNWLSAHKGRIVDGMRFEPMGERSHATVWMLALDR